MSYRVPLIQKDNGAYLPFVSVLADTDTQAARYERYNCWLLGKYANDDNFFVCIDPSMSWDTPESRLTPGTEMIAKVYMHKKEEIL